MFANQYTFLQELFQFALEKALYSVGIETDTMQAEGTGGQVEFTFVPKFDIRTADENFIFKEIVKELAPQHKMQANFMAMPAPEQVSITPYSHA